MNEAQMKQRTKAFTLRVLKLVDTMPNTRCVNAVANQLVRSGSSVGANYRALCRAKSRADFAHKTSIVEEEADESSFWLEITIEAELLAKGRVQPLLDEANQITAMMVASRKTVMRPAPRRPIEIRKSKTENHDVT
jgi:four helix bundle protein